MTPLPCPACGGLGRLADHPCRICDGSGMFTPPTQAPRVRCVRCGGDGCEPGVELANLSCIECGGIGSQLACVECHVGAQEPMFAPCCSATCRDAWDEKQRRAGPKPPLVTRAP